MPVALPKQKVQGLSDNNPEILTLDQPLLDILQPLLARSRDRIWHKQKGLAKTPHLRLFGVPIFDIAAHSDQNGHVLPSRGRPCFGTFSNIVRIDDVTVVALDLVM